MGAPAAAPRVPKPLVGQLVEGAQRWEAGRQTGAAQLEDMLGPAKVFEALLAQIGQGRAPGELVAHQLGGGGGEQDLPSGGDRHQAGGAVERRAKIVAIAQLGLAGMQPHAHAQRAGEARPGFACQGLLAGQGRSGAV